MLRRDDEESRAKITADIDAIMTAEVRQGIFKIFLTRSKLADYIREHHSKMWFKCKWNRLDELEAYFSDLEHRSSRPGEEVDWKAVKKRGPAEVLNQLDRDMQKQLASHYPEAEFLHLRQFSAQLALGGEQEYTLEVLKSPQQIAKAGLKLHNCAASKIRQVSIKSAILCGIRETQSGKVIGMAEYAADDNNWGLKQASAAANQPLPEELAAQIRDQGRIFVREGMRCKLSLRAEMLDGVNLDGEVYDQGLSDRLRGFLKGFLECSGSCKYVMWEPERQFCDPELFYRDVGPLAATFLLPFCAAAGSRELVEHFLEQGADLNYTITMRCSTRRNDVVKGTPVTLAARLKHWEVVNRLVEAGADSNVKVSRGSSLVKLAAEDGQMDFLDLLRRRDVPVFESLVEHGSVFHIEQLARHLELKRDKILAEIGHGGRSAFMASVRCGRADMVVYLLQLGCSPDMTDARGQTALMAACMSTSKQAPRIIRSLLAHGAGKDAVWNGETALKLACDRVNVEAAAELLQNGVDATLAGSLLVSVLERGHVGVSPLFRRYAELASLLVDAGGDIVLERLSRKKRNKAQELLRLQARRVRA